MEAHVVAMLPVFEAGKTTEICNKLQEFNKEYAQTFGFSQLQPKTKEKFVSSIISTLQTKKDLECLHLCLEATRILSREKFRFYGLANEEGVSVLLRMAGLSEDTYEINLGIITEAEKSLCNLVYNSSEVQKICVEMDCVSHILARVKQYREGDIPPEIKFYDMRFLFLLTALCPQLRNRVREDLNGLMILAKVLEHDCLQSSQASGMNGAVGGAVEGDEVCTEPDKLTDEQCDLACEILKAVFNTLIHTRQTEMEGDFEFLKRQGKIIRRLLHAECTSDEKSEELHGHTINLLTCALPPCCIEQLVPEPVEGALGGNAMYNGHSMDTVLVILSFLEGKLDRVSASKDKGASERISPCLGALSKISKTNSNIRKFLRERVLPPLKDATKLPEEGSDIRNKLVRLMTNPSTDIKESVADFLFILCKENVNRLIKYTGFGNAAGMLVRRQLLCGGRGSVEDYSSDDEDSDTEEYQNVRQKVNPVTGRVEEEKVDPMEGMTEEQKEYHAIELANMIAKMSRQGIVQPVSVGPDGSLMGIEEMVARTELPPEPTSDDEEEDN